MFRNDFALLAHSHLLRNLVLKHFITRVAVLLAITGAPAVAQTTLGAYTFNNSLFGNTLTASDGFIQTNSNWLNTVNANPGSPGFLTGANFNTGIANIGISGSTVYTIGYNTAIVNGAGADLGVVMARYSSDPFNIAFSTDGITFSAGVNYAAATAVSTGVTRNYFYGGSGPFEATLFVQSVDLSDFGFAAGANIVAARITSNKELDLIRVAGFGNGVTVTPEPSSYAMMVGGLLALGVAARRRKRVA